MRRVDAGRVVGLILATQREHRLHEDVWREFFDVVYSSRPREVEVNIRTWARSQHPSGIRSKFNTPLVHAVSKEDFVRNLHEQSLTAGRRLVPDLVARDIYLDLTNPSRWRAGIVRAKRYGLTISQYTTWSTFDEHRSKYAGLHLLTAEEVACDLGLDEPTSPTERWTQAPMVLMEYELDRPDLEVYIPTMVQAWSPAMPNFYFEPALPTAKHGETRPWRTPPSGHSPRSRPEVVHRASPLTGLRSRAMEVY
ncbi:MAG: hypothetical protein JWP19_2236 [Rhodoglobus sp.]|nr:hypothetical protein [Rhodoglobus sp.]